MAKADSSEYKSWEARLAVSHKIHEKRIKEPVERNLRYYRGDQWQDKDARKLYPNDHPVDNVIFSNVATIKPSINFANPKLFVRPRSPVRRTENGIIDTIRAAKLVQMLVNYDYRELRLKRQMDCALVDALLGPYGCMYLGYTLKTEKFKGGKEDKEQIELHELIQEDSPFAVRLSPMDLRVDPEGKDHLLDDHRWIAIRWVKDLDDVKADPRYTNTKNLKPNFNINIEKEMGVEKNNKGQMTLDHNDLKKFKPGDLWKKVEGWDIWDKKTHEIRTIVEGHGHFLRQDKGWPIKLEGFPVEMLYFNENPDDFYPISDVDIYIDSQDELNRIKAMKMEHLRRISRRRYLARRDAMDPEDMENFKDGPDGTIGEVDGNPNDVVVPVKDAPISQDFHIVEQSIKQSIREESGVNQFEKGIGRGVDSATESALIDRGTKTRRLDREMLFKDFAIRVSRKLLHIRQQTLDTKTSIPLGQEDFEMAEKNGISQLEKITTPEGQEVLLPWLTLGKDDIQGDFEFDLDISSLRMRNEDQEKQEALMLYQGAAQDPFIDPIQPRRNVLEKFNVPNVDDWLRDPQEVMQQMAQAQQSEQAFEMEKEKLQRGVDLEKTKIKTEQQDVDSKRKFAVDSGNVIIAALQSGKEEKGKESEDKK